MKSHWIQIDGTEEVREGPEPEWKDVQKFVGGFIELVVVLYEGQMCHMAVKDDALIIGLPVNEVATHLYHERIKAISEVEGAPFLPEAYGEIRGPVVVLEGRFS